MNLLKKLVGVFITYSVCYALLVVAYTYQFFKGRIPARNGVDIMLMLFAGMYTIYFYWVKNKIKRFFGHTKELKEMQKRI